MQAEPSPFPLISDELSVLSEVAVLADRQIIELGCGAARMARQLLERYPDSCVTGLETDDRQHAKNIALPQERLRFLLAGAQDIPVADASFDLALMLKSLHHVPIPMMKQALEEVRRVVRVGGHLYVSEPVYSGPLNEIIRLFKDERDVRLAAQAAVDDALISQVWTQVAERRFETPVRFNDFADFERRMLRPTYANHRIDDATVGAVRELFEPHCRGDGAYFTRPMHVRLLRR